MTIEQLLALLERANDLSTLTDEDLATLDGELIAAFQDLSTTATAETLAHLSRLADATDAIRLEAAARIERDEALRAEVAALAARVAPPVAQDPEPEPEAEPDPDDGEGDAPDEAESSVVEAAEAILEEAPVLETVTASTPRERRTTTLAPLGRLSGDTARVAATARRSAEIAVAYTDPRETVTRRSLAEAMIRADKGAGRAAVGIEVRLPVATVTAAWDDDRRIPEGVSAAQAAAIVERVTGPDALTASGGICAPVTPYYGSEVIASRARPVRDFLTGFQAARGGIAFTRPYSLSSFSSAITNHTMAADEAGSTKACLTVTCPTPGEEVVGAVVACLEFGNFQGRFNPEQVAAATELTAAAHARVAEGLLLDALRASQNYEVTTIAGGAIADMLYAVGAAGAGYRSRNRMDPNAILDVLMPAWVPAMLQADLARQPHEEYGTGSSFGIVEAAIVTWLAARKIRTGFYLDTPSSGTSQVFAAQPGGGLLDFPETVQWGMWHPGAHLFLDGGTLDLGIVRDSTLNATNDYQQFMETFEGHAFTGVESLWVESTVCPSGTQSLPKDLSSLCGGPYVPGS